MIHRFSENPLISPDPSIPWMTENAFNPGVVKNDDMFHMLIRGGTNRRDQGFSNLGYASSMDGISWDIFQHPVLCYDDYGSTADYGFQDPRIVRWNNSFYIFATLQKKYYCRMGIWQTEDFETFNFKGIPFDWEDKNASIIPEVINDKVYLIHRMLPNMWLAETFNHNVVVSWVSNCILLRAEDIKLDGLTPIKIGLAAPPVKLEKDWLVLFHAKFEPFEYRIGFMILDGANPRLIKYLHPESILKPELPCEKWGAVPYVCFLTGMVDVGDRWYVYWGAADTVICGGYLLKQDIKQHEEE